jgi:hypothetical protein
VSPRISTFLAAALQVSSPSQPNSQIVVRYSSRNNTAPDHVLITWGQWNLSHHSCGEFWHTTGQAHARGGGQSRSMRWTCVVGGPCWSLAAADTAGAEIADQFRVVMPPGMIIIVGAGA